MRKKDRVLLYAPHFAEYSTRLAQSLSAHAEVLLVIDGQNRREQCQDEWFRSATAQVRVIEFFVNRSILRLIWTPLLILAGLWFRPKVFHIQEQADFTSFWFTKILSLTTPVVVTVHDPTPHSGRDSEFIRLRGQGYRDQIRASASLFHVHGAFCRRQMLDLDSSRPVVQTYHGVLHVPALDQMREPEPNRILFFGRMEAYKGLEILLNAIDTANARGRDYKLVIAGRGDELDRLRARASATRGVVLRDAFLTPEEVVAQFQMCAVVVLPYLDATQSGVAAAAIGNGRPAVSSAIGGLPDVIVEGENGILVPPGDPMALADALDRILQDTKLREALTKGARSAQSRLDWDLAARTIIGGYRAMPSVAWSGD